MTVSEDLQTGTGKMGMRRNLLWKTHRYYSISYGPWKIKIKIIAPIAKEIIQIGRAHV